MCATMNPRYQHRKYICISSGACPGGGPKGPGPPPLEIEMQKKKKKKKIK